MVLNGKFEDYARQAFLGWLIENVEDEEKRNYIIDYTKSLYETAKQAGRDEVTIPMYEVLGQVPRKHGF